MTTLSSNITREELEQFYGKQTMLSKRTLVAEYGTAGFNLLLEKGMIERDDDVRSGYRLVVAKAR